MAKKVLNGFPNLDCPLQIPTFDASELDEQYLIHHFINPNQPCLIKNATSHWAAMKKWQNLDYLASVSGHNNVFVYSDINTYDADKIESKTEETFSSAIIRLMDPLQEVVSIPMVPIPEKGAFSELNTDIGTFPFYPHLMPSLLYPVNRFFLYKNAGTGWHFHPIDETFMCQLVGSKQVALLSTKNKLYNELKKMAKYDEYLSPETLPPRFKAELTPYLITVEAGDALYIPPHWWHAIDPLDSTTLGMTLAVTFRSPLHKLCDLSYPSVRNLWKTVLKKPGMNTIKMCVFGLMGLYGQITFHLHRLFNRKRSAVKMKDNKSNDLSNKKTRK